jgi:hypothetical protein
MAMATKRLTETALGDVQVHRNKWVVEFLDPGWMVMSPDGDLQEWDTAGHALSHVRREERKRVRGTHALSVATVEWRNVREGWEPPK